MFKYNHCYEAAQAGDLEELKKMHEANLEWDELTTSTAALKGHLDCLKYAHENGCLWTAEATQLAARNGHLDCLKYAHKNGCEWNVNTTEFAVMYGHVDCLEYAMHNGCFFDEVIPVLAASNGDLDCFLCCFLFWKSSQKFWNIKFDLSKLLNKIDLSKPEWKPVLTLNLTKNPSMQTKVNNYLKSLNNM
jgi:hypothetical protein